MEKLRELDNEDFQKIGKAEIRILGEGTWRLFKDHLIKPGRFGLRNVTIKYDVRIEKCTVGQRLEI